MKKNSVNSLLIKNGFRVFGKTKMLAMQLTVLTTLASTGVITTILTNYNLDMSKEAILTEGNAFDFSIETNINNDIPVQVEKLSEQEAKLFTVPYQNHLNSSVSTHDFSSKQFSWNGQSLNSKAGNTIWNQYVTPENQKLVYYFATIPTQSGDNLFRLRNYNDNLFASLTEIPQEIKNDILSNASEIFSFCAGSSSDTQGIPQVINGELNNSQSFNLNNVLLNENNQPIGVPAFGQIQATGFEPKNEILITHNVVNTKNVEQDDFNVFRNKIRDYSVPGNYKIYLGDQNKYIEQYATQIRTILRGRMWPDQQTLNNNIEILLGVGDSFNQLATNNQNIVNDTKWTPFLIKLNPNLLRGVDLFCYQMLFNQTNQKPIFSYFYDVFVKNNILADNKRLDENEINLQNLISLQNQYSFLKYFQTIIWVPSYLNNEQIEKEIIYASNQWYSSSHQYFESLISTSYRFNQWESEYKNVIAKLKDILISNPTLNANELFELLVGYLKITTFYTFQANYLIDILENNKNNFLKQLDSSTKNDFNIWENFVSTKIYKALQQFISPSFFYYSWYTTEGLLNIFGFPYNKSSDFTSQMNNEGISYTYSKIDKNAKVNKVVSNSYIDWEFMEPTLEFDINNFLSVIEDFKNMRTAVINGDPFPISTYNYQWFVTKKPYMVASILANSTVYDGNAEQVSKIVNTCKDLAELDLNVIKNDNDIINKWVPVYKKMATGFQFNTTYINDNVVSLELKYLLGFAGDGATIPVQATILDKSAFVSLVSEGYLNANLYSENNLNGKSVYPYYDSYAKARKLPFFDPTAHNLVSDFSPTSPNWIYNYDTGKYDYCPDFFAWLNTIPNKYKLTINNQNILITGTAISPDFLYPTQNENNLLINPKQTPILYTNDYGYVYALKSSTIVNSSSYYAVKDVEFNHWNYYFKEYLGIINPFDKFNAILAKNVTNNKIGLAYKVSDPNQPNRLLYTRANFTNIVQHGLLIASIILSLILLVLSGIFACTLIRSIVKQNKKTLGIAISNGIAKYKLSISMMPFALIPGVVAGILGYWFATLLQPLILNSISSYWVLPVTYNYYLWWLFLLIPVFIVGLLFLIIHLVVMWTLRKNVTELLSSSVSFRMNALIENSKWFTRKMRPTSAFKVTYMLGNVTRFLTLVGVITTFIAMASTSVGTLNAFSTAMSYTDKNKNYVYGMDLVSPSIQGGWYYAIPYSQIGTTQQGIENTINQDIDTYQYQEIGSINNKNINAKTNIIGREPTLELWLKNHFSSYVFNTTEDVTIDVSILNKFIDNSDLNLTSLSSTFQTFNNSNILLLTPKTATINGNRTEISVQNPKSIYIEYTGESVTYSSNKFGEYWVDPYNVNLDFTSSYYLSFKIAKQFLSDLQFFKNNLLMELTLDVDFDLGSIRINPWSVSKTLLPKLVVSNSIQSNNNTIERMISFYSYLDQVASGTITPIDPFITYENYYGQMVANKPVNNTNFNPMNINGVPFKFDEYNQPILDPYTCIISRKKEIGAQDSYVLNSNTSVQQLPSFQLKQETIRFFVYMITNPNNAVYQRWLAKVAKVDTEKYGYDSTYKLATNIIPLTDSWNNNDILENTYTYITGEMFQDSKKITDKGKIIGLNNLDNIEKSSVLLYDKNNNIMNGLLQEPLNDGSYPLIINEVVAKLYNLNVGNHISIDPNNDLFRYVDKANNNVDQKRYGFTIVGITTSKSEQQMYTNQAFANEILGYNSSRLNAKESYQGIIDSFGNPYVPFNGFYTNNVYSPMVNNFGSIYSVSGLTPINAMFKKIDNPFAFFDGATTTIDISRNQLNDIVKFNIFNGDESTPDIVNKLINVFGDGLTLNCLTASIKSVDAKFANGLMGKTIDSTLANIQAILITALLPTLLIIICLMATMIVSESRRLIAIMKVLGIGDWKNTFNFLFIYFVVLVFGLIIALPITYGILSLFTNLTFSFFNIIISPAAPWWIYVATVCGLGLIFASMFFVVKEKMSKINLPQAINFES